MLGLISSLVHSLKDKLCSFFFNFAPISKTTDVNLLFFDFGAGEIMLVVLAILLVFGPGKIPEIARTLGKFINEIKRASEDIKTEINREADRQDRDKRFEEYKASMENKSIEPKDEDTDNTTNK
jgi:Tat protein translocase TatB subunit